MRFSIRSESFSLAASGSPAGPVFWTTRTFLSAFERRRCGEQFVANRAVEIDHVADAVGGVRRFPPGGPPPRGVQPASNGRLGDPDLGGNLAAVKTSSASLRTRGSRACLRLLEAAGWEVFWSMMWRKNGCVVGSFPSTRIIRATLENLLCECRK